MSPLAQSPDNAQGAGVLIIASYLASKAIITRKAKETPIE